MSVCQEFTLVPISIPFYLPSKTVADPLQNTSYEDKTISPKKSYTT